MQCGVSLVFGSQFRILCAREQLHSEVCILKSHTRLRGLPSFHRSPHVFLFSPCPGCPVPRPELIYRLEHGQELWTVKRDLSRSTCAGRSQAVGRDPAGSRWPWFPGKRLVRASGGLEAMEPFDPRSLCPRRGQRCTSSDVSWASGLGADHQLCGPSEIWDLLVSARKFV